MSVLIDMTGQVIGRLTVLGRAPENAKDGQAQWLCQCACGNTCTVKGGHLRREDKPTRSCGCLAREKTIERHLKHGMKHDPLFNTHYKMIDRCYNPNNKDYEHYGGRGIKVCDEWLFSFPAFHDYVSKLPHHGEKGYSLDRIDNNLGYQPGNVRYADKKTQNRNKRNNIWVEYNGVKMTLKEASELSGIPYHTLKHRYYRGDTGERLYRPVKKYKK